MNAPPGGAYDDIIRLPRPASLGHPRMALPDRAAQFAPFAALTGYEAAIAETFRLTDERMELDEYTKAALSDRLRVIAYGDAGHCPVSITYFRPDARKRGGDYATAAGTVKKIDEYHRIVVMAGGLKVPIDDIIAIDSAVFEKLFGQ
ncbi:MAG: hypothetical protein EOM58_00980 [Clostridia bacterium]|nr:hypothetical protein [Clostridia bacterium]